MRARVVRVMHIHTEQGWRGGERQLDLLLEGLAKLGVQNSVSVHPAGKLIQRLSTHKVDIINNYVANDLDLLAVVRLVASVRKWDPDLLHAHTAHAHAIGLVAARICGIPLVVHRRVDFVPARNIFSRLKYVNTTSYFICISDAVGSVLRDLGISETQRCLIRSAVPRPEICSLEPDQLLAKRRAARKELGFDESTPLLGTVGHLVPHKGHQVLARAAQALMERHPEARFVWIGDGQERERLQALLRKLHMDRSVRMLGFRDDVLELMLGLDRLVVPSIEEGLNTSILDAKWLKVPLVVCTAGGIPEIVGSDEGFHARPGDPHSLARAMSRSLEDGGEAHARAERAFRGMLPDGPERMAAQTLEWYLRVLGSWKKPSEPL